MASCELFFQDYVRMFDSEVPDLGMFAEKEGPIVRYIGVGDEPFLYSLSCFSHCTSKELLGAIEKELLLAKTRKRKSMEWKVFDGQSLPFEGDHLAAKGFKMERESRLLYLPISELKLKKRESVHVAEIKGESDFDKLLSLNTLVFGGSTDWLQTGLKKEILEKPKQVRAFLSYVDGQLASCAWVKVYNKIGFLFGGGTDPKLRGKGAYSALVAERANFAKSAGCSYVVSECSPDSEKVLKGLDFEDAGKAFQWIKRF